MRMAMSADLEEEEEEGMEEEPEEDDSHYKTDNGYATEGKDRRGSMATTITGGGGMPRESLSNGGLAHRGSPNGGGLEQDELGRGDNVRSSLNHPRPDDARLDPSCLSSALVSVTTAD
ncbi:unnamed protein product [Coregonus sp. 'balchen']|nr:unnamed protein product [Coregonus sp. 'balchen']